MSIAMPNRARPALPSLVAVIALAAAIVAFGVIGFASAQAPPAAPTGVTVLASGGGFVVGWDASDAATSHWVAWMSVKDYDAERAAGDWTKALKYEHVASGGDTYVIPYDSSGEYYWIIVGSVSGASAVTWSSWHREKALVGTIGLTDDEITRAYVEDAIAYYDANGREATIAHYRSEGSVADGRSLTLLDADESMLLVYRIFPVLQDQYVGPGTTYTGFQRLIESATAAGAWVTDRGINPVTRQEEPRRNFVFLHDGLVFYAGHSVLVEDVAAATKEYVNRAIARYDAEGLQATIDYYNSQDSLEGQFYLFFIGADDNYLAHPIFPHLIGTDIKDVVGSDGQRLGEEIAQATEAGIWVEYLWPHPVTRREMQKVTWAARHDGLIFASGYYAGGSDTEAPPWQNVADPEQYTEDYVNRAIARYEEHGLDSMLNYYNSVASFEGQWYLFATDANDIYHVHPLISRLIGTDIKDVVGSDGYELGKALAAAPDGGAGVWVDYLWPHPVTLQEVPKRGYAVRRDGMLFASGYYPQVENPAGRTQDYVQNAIDYYQANGLDKTIAHYNSPESLDGQWNLTLADQNDIVRVAILSPNIIGRNLNLGAIGRQMTAATEDGIWVSVVYPNTRSSETLYAHTWAIRYDGLLFSSRYYDDRPDVPDAAKGDDQLTREYVEAAIARYDRDGRESAFAYYNSPQSLEGERALFVFEPDTFIIWVTLANPAAIGVPLPNHGEATAFMKAWIAATESGEGWFEYQGANYRTGQNEPKRGFGKVHDGHIFISSHSNLQQNIGETTKNYVNQAMAFYDEEGLEATIAHYNSRDSLDGFFYLFLMDENDIYLAHPIREDLRGTDIKEVTGKDFAGNYYELGKDIAKADENGVWVEYLWENPLSGQDEAKTTWAIRYKGLIFASGYYKPLPEEELPACLDADPREYTVDYVNRAIKRYEQDGLAAMVAYYDSVASFECNWYLFATDADDTYIVHPFKPELKGTDIKDLDPNFTDVNGNPLGTELAKAGEGQGVWVKYLWPHPATGWNATKVAYAVRKDGMIFATGYYPAPKDQPAHVQDFVQGAIDVYQNDGLDGVKNIYGQGENSEGLWFLQVLDENTVYVVHGSVPSFVGRDARTLSLPADVDGNPIVPQVLAATEEGVWINIPWAVPNGPENLKAHLWVVKHDGYFFGAAYYDSLPFVRNAE